MNDIEINISSDADNNISNKSTGLYIPKYIPTIDTNGLNPDNIVTFDNGYYAESYDTLQVKISAEEGNKITNDDGLYIEKQETSTVLLSTESNNEIKESNGLYLKDKSLKLSTESNNAIIEKEDGLYLEKIEFKEDVKISEEADNSLINNNGLYVKGTEPKLSAKEKNSLVMKSDGIYLADSNVEVSISPDANNRISDSNGLFSSKTPDFSQIKISTTADNRLKLETDGLYVSEINSTIDTSIKSTKLPINEYTKDMYGNGMMISKYTLKSYSADNYKFAGASFHDDNIYFCPYNARGIVKYNVKTHEEQTFAVRDQEIRGYWHGSIKYKNKIIHVPWSGKTVGVFNLSTDSLSEFGSYEGTGKWGCAALSSKKRIYCIPHTAMQMLVIDNLEAETPTSRLIGSYPGSNKWTSAVIDSKGDIYCIPFISKNILKIIPGDTIDEDVYETIPLPAELQNIDYKWRSGTIAPNGNLYLIPYGANMILVYNPTLKTFNTIPVTAAESYKYKFVGCTLGTNGMIYGMPYDFTQIIEINPNTNELRYISTSYNANSSISFGSIMDDDGNIYTVPNGISDVIKISPPNSGVHSWAASPYINKF